MKYTVQSIYNTYSLAQLNTIKSDILHYIENATLTEMLMLRDYIDELQLQKLNKPITPNTPVAANVAPQFPPHG